jgi:hypothetical protein
VIVSEVILFAICDKMSYHDSNRYLFFYQSPTLARLGELVQSYRQQREIETSAITISSIAPIAVSRNRLSSPLRLSNKQNKKTRWTAYEFGLNLDPLA